MSTRRNDLQAVARRFLEATGNSRPSSDAGALALCCGYTLRAVKGRGVRLRGGVLSYGMGAPRQTQQRLIAEIVARHALAREGLRPTRRAAAQIAPLLIA